MALTHGVKEIIFLRDLLAELNANQSETVVHVDNQSSMTMTVNSVHHQRIKHIDTCYHFIRERIEDRHVVLEYVNTKLNSNDKGCHS